MAVFFLNQKFGNGAIAIPLSLAVCAVFGLIVERIAVPP